MIVVNPVGMMCNCYGSHVLRSLLCLCGGVPLDCPEFHGAKPSTILAERLNLRASGVHGNDSPHLEQRFPDLLKFLVSEMLKCASEDIKALLVDQYSSLVLQVCSNFPYSYIFCFPSFCYFNLNFGWQGCMIVN